MSARDMAHKVVTFPPFIALIVAVLLSPVAFPPVLKEALARIGDTLAPLALLSVGMQLRFDALREESRLLCIGLGYKLLVCPGLVIALLWLLDVEPDPTSRVSVIEAAMPPMIGAAVVATQYKLAPRLTSLLVGLGIPLDLFTASAWFWLFGAITR
jgi:predicted permease